MKIKLNLYIFLIFILFFITKQLEIYLLIMIFTLIHELSHLFVGIILGLKATSLSILPLGFCVEFQTNVEDYNKKIIKSNMLSVKKIIIALAGPLINFIIVIIGEIYNIDKNIIYSNLLIMLFNLIPIYPLDGGKILKNIIKIFFGNNKSNKYTNIISNVFIIVLTMISSILLIQYKNIGIFLIIVFLWILIIKENKRYNTYNKIYKTIDKVNNYL